MSGDSCTGNSSRSSSNNYKADRFIPFRGTQDNFFEEYIMNNDLFHENKKKMRKNNEENINTQPQLPPNSANIQDTNVPVGNDNSNYSSASSSSSNNIQYSRGSGNKQKQSYQEFITESLFSSTRGSPNTLTLKEAEEEEFR
jgi:hypothetical protein